MQKPKLSCLWVQYWPVPPVGSVLPGSTHGPDIVWLLIAGIKLLKSPAGITHSLSWLPSPTATWQMKRSKWIRPIFQLLALEFLIVSVVRFPTPRPQLASVEQLQSLLHWLNSSSLVPARLCWPCPSNLSAFQDPIYWQVEAGSWQSNSSHPQHPVLEWFPQALWLSGAPHHILVLKGTLDSYRVNPS